MIPIAKQERTDKLCAVDGLILLVLKDLNQIQESFIALLEPLDFEHLDWDWVHHNVLLAYVLFFHFFAYFFIARLILHAILFVPKRYELLLGGDVQRDYLLSVRRLDKDIIKGLDYLRWGMLQQLFDIVKWDEEIL